MKTKKILLISYTKNKDVTYFGDGEILTKNLLIDGAKITLQSSEILQIETNSFGSSSSQDAQTAKGYIWILIVIGGSVALGAGVGTFLWLKKRKKEKKWVKL